MEAGPMTPNETNTSNRVCPHTIAFMLDNPLRRLIQGPGRIVGSYIKTGDIAMDLGCGPGYFTIHMARMVGASGRVFAVDLQSKMLEHVKRKALKHQVAERITFHQCGPAHLDLSAKADFILAYYMVHETPNPAAFFSETRALLNAHGRFLIVEPRFHVKKDAFEAMVGLAVQNGFKVIDRPKRKGGRSVLLA